MLGSFADAEDLVQEVLLKAWRARDSYAGEKPLGHWSAGFRALPTRANGELALAFYRRWGADYRPSSLQVVRFVDDRLAEIVAFVGPAYHRGFDLPDHLSP